MSLTSVVQVAVRALMERTQPKAGYFSSCSLG